MKPYVILGLALLLLVAACNQEQLEQTTQQDDHMDAMADQVDDSRQDDSMMDGADSMMEEAEDHMETTTTTTSDLAKKFAGLKTLEYVVSYDMKTVANGQQSSGEMTQYIKGQDMFRFDFETQGVESRTYLEGSTFTTCSMNDGSWTCYQIEQDQSESDKLQEDVQENVEDYDVEELAGRTIAGVSAECYRILVDESNVEYCFSSDGVPLYVKTEGSSQGQSFSSELTATEYSKNVPSSAFDLPAEPQDLGSMGGFDPSQFT